jgi:hypothetical protein
VDDKQVRHRRLYVDGSPRSQQTRPSQIDFAMQKRHFLPADCKLALRIFSCPGSWRPKSSETRPGPPGWLSQRRGHYRRRAEPPQDQPT